MNNQRYLHIDTHRHLGGCIPPWWVWQTIVENDWFYIGENQQEIVKSMTFEHDEPKNFHRFLDKFNILDQIKWDEKLIDSSIGAVCQEIDRENLDFCWLDFSINKYMEAMSWHKKEAIKFIHGRFDHYLPNKIGLILSLKYESTQASQRQYAKLIEDPDVFELLFGIDLVGDESYFDHKFYQPIFKEWKRAGKMTRTHASESQDFNNCKKSIQELHVTNIAHGITIYNNKEVLQLAKDHNVTFDLGISSNYQTGVWKDTTQHPVKSMLDEGLKVTLGTDDPVQCDSTLHGEYQLAEDLGVSKQHLTFMRNIAQSNTELFAHQSFNILQLQ
jgi:adenosine deaminase